MKETRKHNEKSKENSKNGSRPLHPGKRIGTSAEMALLRLWKQSTRPGTKTALTHEQIAERAYWLWRQSGRLPEQEEDFWLQVKPDSNEKFEEIETKKHGGKA